MRTQELPPLFGLSRIGKVKQWQAKVMENEDKTATVIIQSGYVGGKIRDIPRIIKKGKNIGKSNETTPFEQAASEVQSQWNSKRDENYELHMIDPDNYTPRIMLPQKAAQPGKGKIVCPCYVQPKLNGVCNLAELTWPQSVDSVILHHTKGGHLFETLEHLDFYIHKLKAPGPLHGELYLHGWSLQKIRSYTQKVKPDQQVLEYWLYDMAWPGVPYSERISWINQNVSALNREHPDYCPIKYTPTDIAENYEEAKIYHDAYVMGGYEGAVLKNKDGIYLYQHRSKDTEKMKDFQAEEFEIIGGKEGTGTDAGCVIYRCITEDGKEFSARPKGSVEDRQQMLIELPDSIGKMLTVRFAEYSEDGVPQHTVGMPEAEVVKDYE